MLSSGKYTVLHHWCFAACDCANLQTNLYLSLYSAHCNIGVYSSTCEQDAAVNELKCRML